MAGTEVPIELNNQSVLMELDTGAGIAIVSEETYTTLMYPLSLVPSRCMLKLETPFKFVDSSLSMLDASPILQSFPSLLSLVLDPHS